MTAHISNADARRLGLIPGGKTKPTRKEAAGPYRTVCVMCKEQFTTPAAEDRHLTETGHPRYCLIVGEREP
jgi:hypothetical protein